MLTGYDVVPVIWGICLVAACIGLVVFVRWLVHEDARRVEDQIEESKVALITPPETVRPKVPVAA